MIDIIDKMHTNCPDGLMFVNIQMGCDAIKKERKKKGNLI